MIDERRLAARLARVSEDLLGADEEVTFDGVVRRAVDVVPGCSAASVTLRRRRGHAETVAATDARLERLDALQYALGEGPCVDAAFETENVLAADLRSEDRWPRWAEAAGSEGFHATLAIRLHTATETLGALNLYAEEPGAFDEEAVDVALIYAAHATAAMSTARLVGGLRAALESRHTIGIAQGILAMRYDISYERAFEVLHRFSNDNNVKLREVAETVARERDLPASQTDVGAGAGELDHA